jgi:hypothetical protein
MSFRTAVAWVLLVLSPALVVGPATAAEPAEDARLRIGSMELQRLIELEKGESADFGLRWSTAEAVRRGESAAPLEARLRRIEVYAPDARILEVTADGVRELPRDARLHFVAEGSAGQRLGLSLDPKSGIAEGLLLRDGRMFALAGVRDGEALELVATDTSQPLPDGSTPEFSCSGDMGAASQAASKSLRLSARDALPTAHSAARFDSALGSATARAAAKAATRQLTVAVDTDNELLQRKFSDNTTAATQYVAALFTALNAIYEDDPAQYGLQLRLLQGTLILRPSSSADPYANDDSSATGAALSEFGAWWRDNQAAVPRAFAILLSGKSSSQNSASGIAWLLTSGTYCDAKGSAGSQASGHYSVNRVFWNPGLTAAQDAYLVGHELGHNLGARHTHCANASTGAQASTGTIDRCYSGESGLGCYAGPQACPSGGESPLAPQGTLMSYCHLNGLGCGVSTEIHPTHVTQLNARLASQPATCLTPVGGTNQAPTLNAPASLALTEDVAQALSGISVADPDSAALTLNLSLPAGSGSLSANSGGGVAVSGNSSARTLTGSPAALNTFLSGGGVNYAPVANFNGSVSLSLQLSDGLAAPVSRSTTLNIAAVNDAPTLNAPVSLAALPGAAVSIGGVSYADPDAPTGAIAVVATFAAPSGSFTASSGGGVSVNGSGSANLQLSGTLAAINSFVASTPVRYTAAPAAAGTAVTLTLTINDQGNTGSGGARSASRNVIANVAATGPLFMDGFEP